ncbi:TRM11 [Mytilus edulis]|uniref:TRM11 n=1 Tax=Mytilus edulis TaxID=6550 RepID=A0A8S3TM76_MYTED|nr:TRM11 [Mytilus edulis]
MQLSPLSHFLSESPYLMVELNSEKEARNLMSRTVLIKSLYEVWGHGATYKEVSEQVETIPAEIKIADGQRDLIQQFHLTKRHFIAPYENQYEFWFLSSYTEDNLPTHPCLRLDSNCEQTLSTRISRRLITMVKCKEFKDDDMGKAQIPVDHYDNKPFRDLYYKNSQSNTQSVENTLKKTSLNDT